MNKLFCKNTNSDFYREVWELYESSFPQIERRTFSLHAKATEDERFFPSVYTSDASELLAICFYWDFPDFRYLEHLAVRPNIRSQGIGSQIIKELTTDRRTVILEIEPPIDKQSKQRLNFYERNNFIHTNYKFTQLKYRKNNAEIQLDLLCNKPMNEGLYIKFGQIINKELQKYNEK